MDPDTPRTLPEDDDELMEMVAEAILSKEVAAMRVVAIWAPVRQPDGSVKYIKQSVDRERLPESWCASCNGADRLLYSPERDAWLCERCRDRQPKVVHLALFGNTSFYVIRWPKFRHNHDEV